MTETEPQLPDSTVLPDVYTFTDETSRAAAEKMATTGLSSLVVVDRPTGAIIGTISLSDLLRGRQRSVQREQDRQRVFSAIR